MTAHCNCDIKYHVYTKKTYGNGTIHCHFFCQKCGVSRSVPKKDIDVNSLEDYDDVMPALVQMHKDLVGADNEPWARVEYYSYMNSDEWFSKRQEILYKYDHICQICFYEANDIHHLNYAHLGNEYNFELIPLCRACHINYYHNGKIKE